MGRIRTVKPELFRNEDLYDAYKETGLPVRTAFIALLTECDKEGRFKWKPRSLKVACLPFDDVDMERVLHTLNTRGFIQKYMCQVDGKTEFLGCIPSFKKHQHINNKEKESFLPAPDTPGSEIIEPMTCSPHEDHTSTSRTRGKGKEGKGKEQGKEQELKDLCQADARPDADEQTGEVILSGEPLPEETDPKARASSQQKQARAIDDIFQCWQTIMGHPNAKLDDKRRKLIRNALKTGYAVNDLKTAILGCSKTPHNMGDNDRGQRYDGLHVIFKNADQIDRFIHNAMNQESMDANRENHQRGKNGLTFLDRDLTGTLDELWEKS